MVGLGIIVAILIVGGIFFFSNNSQSEANPNTINNGGNSVFGSKLNSIDDVISKLSETFEIGEKEETWYQLIGAYDGTKIDVDDTKIEIYQFKDSQNEAKNSAMDSADTVDNIIFEVDNFMILVHSTDEEFAERIKQALN